ncbi:hypothetical protein U8527_09015 [Kordia algicida OT-1]|uniref:Uncharacterized protein n=1 Tax=Kordia algicida OT-1 TaxID=391587 RepID=A9DTY8_9FLAO|nr:hypothetical protein [Kordia algicida]EDP96239.1 hypothetical protein KAOT1_02482 [Kordia algicida OT-1]
MSDQNNMTQGMAETQNAIDYINKSVLQPDVDAISGTAAPMVDQAVGMMVQDLQSFLKGFEQISLVALAKLANNILTYGTYFDGGTSDNNVTASVKTGVSDNPQTLETENPINLDSEVLKGLFSSVGEYGKLKAEINQIYGAGQVSRTTQNSSSASNSTSNSTSNSNSSSSSSPNQPEKKTNK